MQTVSHMFLSKKGNAVLRGEYDMQIELGQRLWHWCIRFVLCNPFRVDDPGVSIPRVRSATLGCVVRPFQGPRPAGEAKISSSIPDQFRRRPLFHESLEIDARAFKSPNREAVPQQSPAWRERSLRNGKP